ncbi:MAG: hypothetical protein AMXMBFR4_16870 [Candidatus Hydrogenedentota bacterium]
MIVRPSRSAARSASEPAGSGQSTPNTMAHATAVAAHVMYVLATRHTRPRAGLIVVHRPLGFHFVYGPQ